VDIDPTNKLCGHFTNAVFYSANSKLHALKHDHEGGTVLINFKLNLWLTAPKGATQLTRLLLDLEVSVSENFNQETNSICIESNKLCEREQYYP
jgi:hypothetical protein